MASLFIVPALENLPSCSSSPSSCQCYESSRHGPLRQRALFRQWSPFESSQLSSLLELTNDERDFLDHTENLQNSWELLSLLLHLRNRRSATKENECTAASDCSTETDRHVFEKTEQKVSAEDAKRFDNFTVSVFVGDAFKPSEISVQVTGKSLKIEGKHEEMEDDGHVSCTQFTRSFYLPDDIDIENMVSTLSKGVLSVEAPRLQLKEKESEERSIAIQQTTSAEAFEEKKSEDADSSDDPKTNPGEEDYEMELESTENEPDKPKENENSSKD